METKDYIIIGLIVIITIGIISAGLYILHPEQKYKTINIIGTSMEVPEANATVNITSENYQEYVDESNNLTISAFDSVGAGFGDMSEAINFATQRELAQVGASEVNVDNITLNKSSNGTYSYLVNESHKNIIVYSSDSKLVAHIAQTFQIPNNNNTNNTTNNDQFINQENTAKSSSNQEDNNVSDSDSKSHYTSEEAARNSKNYDLKEGEQNKNDYIYSAEGKKMYWTNDGYDGSYLPEGEI